MYRVHSGLMLVLNVDDDVLCPFWAHVVLVDVP